MEKVFDFFANTNKIGFLERKLSNSLVVINIVLILLLTSVLIFTLATKLEDTDLILTIILLGITQIGSLLLLKFKNRLWAGNFFSLATNLIIAYGTAFFIFKPMPEVNIAQGLYMMLASISFSLLFANKRFLVINAGVALLAVVIYYFQLKTHYGTISKRGKKNCIK